MVVFFFFLLFLICYPVLLFPVFLFVVARFFKSPHRPELQDLPQISLIIVVRNGEEFVLEKIRNSLDLDYPPELLEILVGSDGSIDRTVELVRQLADPRLHCVEFTGHRGKIEVLNQLVSKSRGEILVFTDISAMLSSDVLKKMAPWFRDGRVGAVAARKMSRMLRIGKLDCAEKTYGGYEHLLRYWETRIGGAVSCEGFLYGVRRQLVRPIPPGVSDDLFVSMMVVDQGGLIVYDPEIAATVPVRARLPGHELQRRRRIVCQSLRGIWRMRRLLNPLRQSCYAWILASHKLLRRLVPVAWLAFFMVNLVLLPQHLFFVIIFSLQVLVLLLSVVKYSGLLSGQLKAGFLQRAVNAAYYFSLGILGTLLGLLDLVRGRTHEKWDPLNSQ